MAGDLGGRHPPKMLYFPATATALVRQMPVSQVASIEQAEKRYRKSLFDLTQSSGDVELFD